MLVRMKQGRRFRLVIRGCAAFGCVLVMPAAASAAASTPSTARGTVVSAGWSGLTIQTGGKRMSVISALTAGANALTAGDYPYVYGGGHPQAGVASIGIKGGTGANGHTLGFDCSGAVTAVLAGAGLWAAGSGVPSEAGVIAQLMTQKLIARGRGTGSTEVTLYDDPGVHIFMNINGRYFGTSDGGAGNAHGWAGWLNDGAPDAASKSFKPYHVQPAVLKRQTLYGPTMSFGLGKNSSSVYGLSAGDKVTVTYTRGKSSVLTLQTVTAG
jgi:hypothetical protein